MFGLLDWAESPISDYAVTEEQRAEIEAALDHLYQLAEKYNLPLNALIGVRQDEEGFEGLGRAHVSADLGRNLAETLLGYVIGTEGVISSHYEGTMGDVIEAAKHRIMKIGEKRTLQ
jgi:hypothetical protein